MRYLLSILLSLTACVVFGQNVKILTYNIHHGNPPSAKGIIDLEAIAKVINNSNADIIGIQEVDITVERSNLVNQAEKLAELTNTEYYFSKGINLGEGAYGTLILSKHKIVGKRRYELPMPEKSEMRSLAIVDIELPGGKRISLANTHLDLKEANKIAQVGFINDLLELYSQPFILVGDLNAQPNSKPIELLDNFFVRNKEAGKPTHPNVNPKTEIDYIMVAKHSKFKWKQYHVLPEEYPSDHLPLFAEIEFK